MKTVTQNILYRQALISYAGKYGVTKPSFVNNESLRKMLYLASKKIVEHLQDAG